MSQKNENPETTRTETTENSQDPAEMSLAELLGSSAEIPVAAEAPKRVNHRDDEPASGMVKLAEMVEASSVQNINAPPIADGNGNPVMEEERTSTHPIVFSTPPEPKRSKALPIFFAIAIAVVAIGAVFMMNRGEPEFTPEQLEQIAKLRAERDALQLAHQAQAAPTTATAVSAAEPQSPSANTKGETAEGSQNDPQTPPAEQATPDSPIAAPADEAKDQEQAAPSAEATAPVKKQSRRSRRSARSRSKRNSEPAKAASVARPGEKVSEPTAKVEPRANSKTDELDALLGGSKKRAASEPAAQPAPNKGSTPSKAEVKNAMNPVVSKAKSCSRFSTGTVQVKIVVGNNGRVKQSRALGSFANTTAGKCVEMMARTAKFPKFSDPSFSFTYPVILR